MTRILTYVLCALSINLVYGKEDSTIYSSQNYYFNINSQKLIFQKEQNSDDHILYKNDEELGNFIIHRFDSFKYYKKKKKLFLWSHFDKSVYVFDLNYFVYERHALIPYSNIICMDKEAVIYRFCNSIYSYYKNNSYLIYNFQIELDLPKDIKEIIQFKKELLINFTFDVFGEHNEAEYFTFNYKQKKHKRHSDSLMSCFGEDGIDLFQYDMTGNFAYTKEKILDSNFNIITNNRLNTFNLKGINIKNDSIISLFVESATDKDLANETSCVIQYKTNPYREVLINKILNSQLLSRQELNTINLFEFEVLEQCMKAKNNVKFKTKYWQAFFNLYEFYKRKFQYRRSFTDYYSIDKHNLKIIKETKEKKFGNK
jgi:hypothetical protein